MIQEKEQKLFLIINVKFPHLEYIIIKDAVFCYVCSLFPCGAGREKSKNNWTVIGVCTTGYVVDALNVFEQITGGQQLTLLRTD
ncbi:unnamed protein product [Macrosiphum euphorbiae]|uniref:Uncharacterized protein n=1 Tax=Macrosiphum euphorbiae TaxID=13131 RepID=A0AAV0WFI0_9HEMI|nr:unnamed protein product [Macrosiphum euphorbiae]